MPTIAIDATYVLDPQPSGISVYSRRLIESLAGLESTHTFILGYRLSRWKRRHDILKVVPGTVSGTGGFSTCFFQEPWTFWLPKKAELFHSLAQRPAPFRFRREVVTVHDVFPLTGRSYSTPNFQRKFSALLVEATRRAARVITPSSYTARQVKQHLEVDENKIRVVPEGVDPPEHPLPTEKRRRAREERVGVGNELVLVVGAIQTRKNTIGAVRALALLPNRYRMILAGGNGHGSEAVHEFISKSQLASRVTVEGYVTSKELTTLYQAASVLLFPSFEEGFGLPVLEALAHGLPVVTSNTASLPEVGGDAVLYVDPEDEAQMAAQVHRAVEDRKLREEMIAAGRARAVEFSWKRTAEETLRVYDEALTT
jgi:glycosyltransferase involved in cell wall biosynthesis